MDFAAVVEQYEGPLLRYVATFVDRGSQESEDVVQETFLRLHRQCGREGSQSIGNLSTWLFRVAHNLAIDLVRKRQQRRSAGERLKEEATEETTRAVEQMDGLVDLERREAVEHAMRILGELPTDQRQVLVLKLLEGQTFRQIGDVIGASSGSVAYRLNQGLAELTRRLKEAGVI